MRFAKSIGLDLCITSDETKYENPKTVKKYEKKLAKLQRQLAHKEKRKQSLLQNKKNSFML